jgi:hypothetical protein
MKTINSNDFDKIAGGDYLSALPFLMMAWQLSDPKRGFPDEADSILYYACIGMATMLMAVPEI